MSALATAAPPANVVIIEVVSPPEEAVSADDTTLLMALLPKAEIYVPSLVAGYLGVAEDTVRWHARRRPARFAKIGGRWEWESRDAAARFCAYLLVVSPQARKSWKLIRERFAKDSRLPAR